jgi:hypothetical protein
MVFYVPVYFGFDSVKAVGNDSVVFVLVFEPSMNKRHDNTETASNDDSQKTSIHATTVPGGTGFRL